VTQYGWANAPERIRDQTRNLVEALEQLLSEDLVGVYLYGSLAMGCFNPRASDLDLLVVMRRGMTIETKKRLAELLLRLSNATIRIEISFLTTESLTHWRHPAPYDFHFSEDHRAECDHALRAGKLIEWRGLQGEDPDLAAMIVMARKRGVALYGPLVRATLPSVPQRDFLAAVLNDSAWARERMDQEPVYAILNHCRTLAYLREKLILSKAEGAKWALNRLPRRYHDLVAKALAAYDSDGRLGRSDRTQLRRFLDYAQGEVAVSVRRPILSDLKRALRWLRAQYQRRAEEAAQGQDRFIERVRKSKAQDTPH
jgi:streptomycin 3"-adenylyltransferase